MNKEYIKSHIAPRNLKPVIMTADEVSSYRDMAAVGIDITAEFTRKGAAIYTGDAIGAGNQMLPPSNGTPVQFLQAWLPDFVKVLTAARKIDELVGITTIGNWYDKEVVQGVVEEYGIARPYSDISDIPLTETNTNFEVRDIVSFEQGCTITLREENRASAMRFDVGAAKRQAANRSLEIARNTIGFNGYGGGQIRVWGLLNDPNLPAAITLPNGSAGTSANSWATKSFQDIVNDIQIAMAALQTQSSDLVNPESVNVTIGVPTSKYQYLATLNTQGNMSVRDWITRTYPKARVVSAPEFQQASGNRDILYVFAENISSADTADSATILQLVPTRFMTVGIEKCVKGITEDYLNAVAGVMVRYPFAVVRAIGA